MRQQRVKRVKRTKKSKMSKRLQKTKRVSRVKRSKIKKNKRRTRRNKRSRRTQINRRRTRRMRGGAVEGFFKEQPEETVIRTLLQPNITFKQLLDMKKTDTSLWPTVNKILDTPEILKEKLSTIDEKELVKLYTKKQSPFYETIAEVVRERLNEEKQKIQTCVTIQQWKLSAPGYVEAAMDETDPRGALIALILSTHADASLGAAALEQELRGLDMGALQRRAQAAGLTEKAKENTVEGLWEDVSAFIQQDSQDQYIKQICDSPEGGLLDLGDYVWVWGNKINRGNYGTTKIIQHGELVAASHLPEPYATNANTYIEAIRDMDFESKLSAKMIGIPLIVQHHTQNTPMRIIRIVNMDGSAYYI